MFLLYFLFLIKFQMKPYVSYRAPQIKEGPMTADRLYQEIKNNIDIIEHREVPWLV